MEKETVLQDIKNIIIEVVGHNNFELNENTTANDVDGWESITHLITTVYKETSN